MIELIHSVYTELYREILRKENVENFPMSSIYKVIGWIIIRHPWRCMKNIKGRWL